MNSRYRVIDLVQGSQEWHDFRKGKIGASMAPAIMGVSPWQTPLQLWEEVVFGISAPKNRAMQRGNDLEEKARQWLKQFKGDLKPTVVQSIAHPDIIASLDGYRSNEGGITIAEIKCPGSETHLLALEGKIPPNYYPQLQHQMDVVGVDTMLYVSFDGTDGVILLCHRDEEYCQKLFQEELAFIASVLRLRPPEPCDRDWVDIIDPRATEKALRYAEIKSILEKYEEEAETLKKDLIEISKHPRSKVGDLKIQKIMRKGAIDYETLLKDYKISNAENYRKPAIDTWRLTI